VKKANPGFEKSNDDLDFYVMENSKIYNSFLSSFLPEKPNYSS
jgi:hypothetical protein